MPLVTYVASGHRQHTCQVSGCVSTESGEATRRSGRVGRTVLRVQPARHPGRAGVAASHAEPRLALHAGGERNVLWRGSATVRFFVPRAVFAHALVSQRRSCQPARQGSHLRVCAQHTARVGAAACWNGPCCVACRLHSSWPAAAWRRAALHRRVPTGLAMRMQQRRRVCGRRSGGRAGRAGRVGFTVLSLSASDSRATHTRPPPAEVFTSRA